MDIIATLEDEVIDALASLQQAGIIKTLDIYEGQLDVEEAELITPTFPCAYVIAGDMDIETKNKLETYDLEIDVLVGDRTLRGAGQARQARKAVRGLYSIRQAIKDKLHLQKILTDFMPPLAIRVGLIGYIPKKSVAIGYIRFKTKGRSS